MWGGLEGGVFFRGLAGRLGGKSCNWRRKKGGIVQFHGKGVKELLSRI